VYTITSIRAAKVFGTRIAIATVFGCSLAGTVLADVVFCAQIAIVARCAIGHICVYTLSCLRIAKVFGTRVAIVTVFGRMLALTSLRIAGIIRTEILVVTIFRCPLAMSIDACIILGTRIYVITRRTVDKYIMKTLNEQRITIVFGTRIPIVALHVRT